MCIRDRSPPSYTNRSALATTLIQENSRNENPPADSPAVRIQTASVVFSCCPPAPLACWELNILLLNHASCCSLLLQQQICTTLSSRRPYGSARGLRALPVRSHAKLPLPTTRTATSPRRVNKTDTAARNRYITNPRSTTPEPQRQRSNPTLPISYPQPSHARMHPNMYPAVFARRVIHHVHTKRAKPALSRDDRMK